MAANQQMVSINLFYSYAHEDESYRQKLENHLSTLRRNGVIRGWHDRAISAGQEWQGEISKNLDDAQIVLLLISVDFLASEYCYDVEMKRAMERHKNGEARVIPIILRPCDWQSTPFGKLLALPKDANPISTWTHQDEAWVDVVKGIEKVCMELQNRATSDPGVTLPPLDPGRIKGIVSFFAILVLLLILYIVTDTLPLSGVNQSELAVLLQSRCWVGYDPLEFNPENNPDPTIESIERDLRWIHRAGFTGIVTFGSRGTLSSIPALAKREGLATIMGVWNPKDMSELQEAARQKDSVTGYCIGHGGLNSRYYYEDLERSMAFLRTQTGLPVTTSEATKMYRDNPQLIKIGDWLFPDTRLSFRNDVAEENEVVDPARDIREFTYGVQEIAAVAKHHGKPLMLKVVSYPWNGIDGTSLDVQRRFFRTAMMFFKDPKFGPPLRISVMAHSAFDNDFKNTGKFNPWDPYTGLLDSDGAARPAVREVIDRCP